MQRRILLTLITLVVVLVACGQSRSLTRFIGKYETEGASIQFTIQKKKLLMIVPGAPPQELKPAGKNTFQSTVFTGQSFVFEEKNGKVTGVRIEKQQWKKSTNNVKILSQRMDSLLTLRKSTEHFSFMYSGTDSGSVDSIASDMEKNYKRILGDFKLKTIPVVTVRIYPDLKSFHNGINFPEAPDQVLATAFGKDDIRMVSPLHAGPESWMMEYAAPHEFTHVVHLNIDYAPNNPRWLWEGLAQFEANWFFAPGELEFMKKKEFPALADLSNGMEYMLGFAVIEAIKDLWSFDVVIGLVKTRGDVQNILKIDQKSFEQKVFEQIYTKHVQN